MAAEAAIFATMEGQREALQISPEKTAGGRPNKADPIRLVAWRQAHKASIQETATRWSVSVATVKRFCKDYGEAARLERLRWECEQLDREAQRHHYALWQTYNRQLSRAVSIAELGYSTCRDEAARAARAARATADFNDHWSRVFGAPPGPMLPE